ncbi:hypothetical protein [Streptomyces sp. NPDC059783]|uniref:hypothetical protein n=1 Tax=Streptomyces sp. NPDC059783 TaxID=3346944 RepID=UPI00365D3ECA
MERWIAFWTALWVGSSKITRWVVDWLCNARPAPAKPAPTKAEVGEPKEQPAEKEKTAGEGRGKKDAKQDPADEGSALLRWFGVLAAAVVAKVLPYTTVITATLAAAWVLTALGLGYAAARPAKPEKPTEGEQPAEDKAAADDRHPRDILTLDHVAQLLADVYTEGSGVHLATLAKHLSKTPLVGLPATPWATSDVRDLLARHEVRIRAGVRVPPVGGREGVHRNDFPPPPQLTSETPVVGDVAAGQGNNNNAYPFEVVDDPDQPNHARVQHHAR